MGKMVRVEGEIIGAAIEDGFGEEKKGKTVS